MACRFCGMPKRTLHAANCTKQGVVGNMIEEFRLNPIYQATEQEKRPVPIYERRDRRGRRRKRNKLLADTPTIPSWGSPILNVDFGDIEINEPRIRWADFDMGDAADQAANAFRRAADQMRELRVVEYPAAGARGYHHEFYRRPAAMNVLNMWDAVPMVHMDYDAPARVEEDPEVRNLTPAQRALRAREQRAARTMEMLDARVPGGRQVNLVRLRNR